MKKNPYILSVIFLVLFSCTEKIDIDLDDNFDRLVVEGYISNDTSEVFQYNYVKLTRTTNYYYNQAAPIVTNASVIISDNDYQYTFLKMNPGYIKQGLILLLLPDRLIPWKLSWRAK